MAQAQHAGDFPALRDAAARLQLSWVAPHFFFQPLAMQQWPYRDLTRAGLL